MKKYVVVYHAPEDVMAQMALATPEQAKAGIEAWMAWARQCGSALVDLGAPLAHGKSLMSTGATGSTKEVCGYSVMQAESIDTVIGLLKAHPHFMTPGHCTIEVHEAQALPGM